LGNDLPGAVHAEAFPARKHDVRTIVGLGQPDRSFPRFDHHPNVIATPAVELIFMENDLW
jgi:hypothetical protein